MEKNITVIGENGDILYGTYPKRAKGLVRKGRAHWVSDSAIRLCVSGKERHENKEESTMANNIYEVFDNQLSKMQEQLRDAGEAASVPVRCRILDTMEFFRAAEQKDMLITLIEKQLSAMQAAMEGEEVFVPENTAARETTRQKMLELMEKLLDKEVSTGTDSSKDTEAEEKIPEQVQ